MPQALVLSRTASPGLWGPFTSTNHLEFAEDLPLQWSLVWALIPHCTAMVYCVQVFLHWDMLGTQCPPQSTRTRPSSPSPRKQEDQLTMQFSLFALISQTTSATPWSLIFFFMERSDNYTFQRMEIKLCQRVPLPHQICSDNKVAGGPRMVLLQIGI